MPPARRCTSPYSAEADTSMNYARIARQLASILGLVTILLLVPFIMAVVDGDANA